MKSSSVTRFAGKHLLPLGVVLLMAAGNAFAGATDLKNIPLAESSSETIPPNIMFILDDSGSMDWDYMPDYVDNSYCRDNDGGSSGLDACVAGDPPYFSNAFNGVYYNPAVVYSPPLNADGSSKTSYNSAALWAAVAKDGYGIQFSGTTNLTTSYPERIWCTTSSLTTCKSAVDSSGYYKYPNSYDSGTTYTYLKTINGAPHYYTTTVEWCSQRNTSGSDKNFGKSGTCQSKKTSTYQYVRYGAFTRVDVVSTNNSYAKASARTDCAGATCTYAEEMTNFANWYAYYRTRMQMMKTAAGRAFSGITDQYRVGFTTISETGATDGSKFLHIDAFNATQKSSWYSKFYDINPSGSTPLRGALSKVGKIYAGVLGADPIQYSCQQNFAILSTDGYWNTGDETSTYGPYKIDGSDVGDQDGSATKPSYDKYAATNTLADIAYYYYHTDLRSGMTNNVPQIGTNDDVDDRAQHQHMTTFTLGLGVDGTLTYVDGYKTSTSGDYFDIKQGTKFWPTPAANSETAIDDLWHAAVNGRGTYFSAKDPSSLASGLTKALSAISISQGSGAAAATSNLEPVAGDNYVYVASYRTLMWDGDVGAYTIDLSTGAVSATPQWLASSLLNSKIGAAGDSDTRTIYTFVSNGGANLKPFTWSDLTATEQSYFNTNQLTQYASWTAAQIAAATGASLVNYLRGQNRNEDQDRPVDYGTYYRLYRDRENVLGDIIHSQPIYVKTPSFNYADNGYSTFKSANASRAATLYVAANDGMLHAFDADTGNERWAYIPPTVLPNLHKLADSGYGTNHRYYVDGAPTVGDVCTASCGTGSAVWKTLLVGGLNMGGRGYYALDITDPANPKALWNFTSANDANLGYTYGKPLITKLGDGTWAVVVTSGYNNGEKQNLGGNNNNPVGDGVGRVYVLNAATGAVIRTISTGEGSAGNPSGLAQLNNWVDSLDLDNTTVRAYGGDLLGNLWRFNLDSGTAFKLTSFGSLQPITVRPELGEIENNTVVFLGTGRYLGQSDLTDTSPQSIYAIKDNLGSTTLTDPRASLVQQTLSTSGANRTASTNAVNWSTGFGWFVDLPDSKERVNVDPLLQLGTLTVASNVPEAEVCTPGGYSWLYSFDYKTGSYVSTATGQLVAKKTSYVTVGLNVVKLPGGTVIIYRTGHKNPIPEKYDMPIGSGSIEAKRIMWRELMNCTYSGGVLKCNE